MRLRAISNSKTRETRETRDTRETEEEVKPVFIGKKLALKIPKNNKLSVVGYVCPKTPFKSALNSPKRVYPLNLNKYRSQNASFERLENVKANSFMESEWSP
jgi:hypothetical protein